MTFVPKIGDIVVVRAPKSHIRVGSWSDWDGQHVKVIRLNGYGDISVTRISDGAIGTLVNSQYEPVVSVEDAMDALKKALTDLRSADYDIEVKVTAPPKQFTL